MNFNAPKSKPISFNHGREPFISVISMADAKFYESNTIRHLGYTFSTDIVAANIDSSAKSALRKFGLL